MMKAGQWCHTCPFQCHHNNNNILTAQKYNQCNCHFKILSLSWSFQMNSLRHFVTLHLMKN